MAPHARAGPRAGRPAPRAGAENHPPLAAGLSVEAVERLARERRHALLHAAAHRSRCAQDAEDAVQEALRIAFERRASIRPATAFAYVAVIARHEAGRLRRIAERTRSLDAPAHPQEPLALVECRPAPARDVDAVLDALEGLRAVRPDEARALMARALGWRYAEIADAFGWSSRRPTAAWPRAAPRCAPAATAEHPDRPRRPAPASPPAAHLGAAGATTTTKERPVVPDPIAVSPTPDPVPPAFSLAERDEYGPILGRPGGLFTAPPTPPIATTEPGPLGRPAARWVPAEHLL